MDGVCEWDPRDTRGETEEIKFKAHCTGPNMGFTFGDPCVLNRKPIRRSQFTHLSQGCAGKKMKNWCRSVHDSQISQESVFYFFR